MADGPDIPAWAYVIGGGAVTTAITKLSDYLKARRREASGDRRQKSADALAEQKQAVEGLGDLIDRLEKRLDETQQEAKDAAAEARNAADRLAECEAGHADCRGRLAVHEAAIRELGMNIGMRLMEPEAGEHG